jgi:hypothetical protein
MEEAHEITGSYTVNVNDRAVLGRQGECAVIDSIFSEPVNEDEPRCGKLFWQQAAVAECLEMHSSGRPTRRVVCAVGGGRRGDFAVVENIDILYTLPLSLGVSGMAYMKEKRTSKAWQLSSSSESSAAPSERLFWGQTHRECITSWIRDRAPATFGSNALALTSST